LILGFLVSVIILPCESGLIPTLDSQKFTHEQLQEINLAAETHSMMRK